MPTIEFSVASSDEKGSIMRRIDDLLGSGVAMKVVGETEIAQARGKRIELFLVPPKVMDIFRRTQGKRNPYCLGIYLGDLTKDDFLLSIEGATLSSPYTERKVRVTDKGEQAVLYGRDITRALTDDFPTCISKGDRVLVMNKLDETLALGKALVAGSNFGNLGGNSLVVKNLLDRGWYLRKGT